MITIVETNTTKCGIQKWEVVLEFDIYSTHDVLSDVKYSDEFTRAFDKVKKAIADIEKAGFESLKFYPHDETATGYTKVTNIVYRKGNIPKFKFSVYRMASDTFNAYAGSDLYGCELTPGQKSFLGGEFGQAILEFQHTDLLERVKESAKKRVIEFMKKDIDKFQHFLEVMQNFQI